MTNSADEFSQWVGGKEVTFDDIQPAIAQAAAAMFDEDSRSLRAGAALPHLWHWFYFLAKAPQSSLGDDGHPRRDSDGFMPPIPYPRRMFAGARLQLHRPLVIGQTARREAVIRHIVKKPGRSGDLAFVTVGYCIFQGNTLCIEEEQDIVYRQPGPPMSAPEPVELAAPPKAAWSRTVMPDTRFLFRFSSLTYNAHRIHYDRPYAMDEEGYPGLVVHGPLTAMLLLRLVSENTRQAIASFSFRGQSPLFDLSPFRLVGVPSHDRIDLEAQGPDAKIAMTATAELASD